MRYDNIGVMLMPTVFDKEKLRQVLKDFHTLTGMTCSVFDANFNQIIFYPNPMATLCAKIKSTPKGRMRCQSSDMQACIKAAEKRAPHTFTCHAGLMDTATPIIYAGEIIGYMMFGQAVDEEGKFADKAKVIAACKNYGLEEGVVDKLYDALLVVNREKIEAAANILHICASYLHLRQIVKVEKNELASSIEAYLDENLERPIRLGDLCKQFSVTKNQLYTLFHTYFKTTVTAYILLKRLERAKSLLAMTNLPISQISEQVGFADYNYFIRLFKKKTGYTPLQFRKKFPHEVIG